MLRVETKIGPSAIHGIGLFADQLITEGTVTWEFDPVFDAAFSEEQIKLILEETKTRTPWRQQHHIACVRRCYREFQRFLHRCRAF